MGWSSFKKDEKSIWIDNNDPQPARSRRGKKSTEYCWWFRNPEKNTWWSVWYPVYIQPVVRRVPVGSTFVWLGESKKHPFHQKEHTKRQIFFQTTPNSLDSIRSVGVLGMQPLKLRVRCLSVKWVSETRGRVSTPWKQFPRRGPFKRGKGNSWRSKKSTHPLKITHTHEENPPKQKKKHTHSSKKKQGFLWKSFILVLVLTLFF